jgi:hypothetical protein
VSFLVLAALSAFACGVSAARLGWVVGESRATTATRGALGAFAAVVVVEELLGLCGRLAAVPIALALAGTGLLAVLAARRAPRDPGLPRAPLAPLEAGLLAALAVALATRAWDGAHRTTFLYDTLSYHLHAPATWLRDRRISIVPAVFGDPAPAYAPANVELFFAFLLAPTRSGALAQAGQAPLAGLAALALAATVREAGGPRAAALAAALAFLLVPEVWQQATSAMTDVGAAAFFFAALPFVVRLARARDAPGSEAVTRDAAALGLAAGLCAGAKVVGAVFVLPVLGVGAALCARGGRRVWRSLGALALAFVATGAFFYARNLIATGNPLYPLALKLGTTTLAPGVYDAAVLRASSYHVARGDLAALGRLLLEPGVAFAVGGLLALALGARRAPAWTALGLVFVALFWLAIPYQESRFLFPLWGVVAIALAMCGRAGATRAAVWSWAPLALGVAGSVVEQPTAERWGVLGAGAAVGALAAWRRTLGDAGPERATRPPSRSSRWPLVAGLGVALVAGAAGRAPARAPAYALGDDLDDAWAWLRANVRGARVAYTGNNLAFPLTGDALANDVRYVNVAGAPGDVLHDFARRARAPSTGPEPAPYRDGARYETWLANLRAARSEVLFVAAVDPAVRETVAADGDGFPAERAWADAHPEIFTPRFASPAARIYGVAP